MNTLKLVHQVNRCTLMLTQIESSANSALFQSAICCRSEEKSLFHCNIFVNATRSANVTNVAAEILFNTSSVNVAGTSPLTTSAITRVTHFISLFKVIPGIEHKRVHGFHTPLLCKNINTVAMLTCDVLLHHFRKRMFLGGIGSCTLLSLVYSCLYSLQLFHRMRKYSATRPPLCRDHFLNPS